MKIEDLLKEPNHEFALTKAIVMITLMQEVLIWCDEFLTARDEMNSKVHCSPVRLSPLTERVKMARKQIEELK